MMGKVFILAGLPGSGKTVGSVFLEKNGIPVVRMGNLTYNRLKEKGLDLTPDNEMSVRKELRKSCGNDIYARTVFPEVSALLKNHPVVVIEGLQSQNELAFFRKTIERLKVVFISVDRKIRYKRLKKRRERSLEENEAAKRDLYEKDKLGLSRLSRISDCIIENNGTEKEFLEKLQSVIKS